MCKRMMEPCTVTGKKKNTNYLSFTKTINRVKYNMKKVIKSNNLNSEIENLINCINDKYKINLSVNKNY